MEGSRRAAVRQHAMLKGKGPAFNPKRGPYNRLAGLTWKGWPLSAPILIPAGYMLKKIAKGPGYLKAPQVEGLFSVSGCISKEFTDFIKHWKHNKYLFFDSPAKIHEICKAENIDVTGMELFFYEIHAEQFDEKTSKWEALRIEDTFETNILLPQESEFLGFDIASHSCGTGPECSPLSCNLLADEFPVNRLCLLDSFDEAVRLTKTVDLSKCEPGPYRIIRVSKVLDNA